MKIFDYKNSNITQNKNSKKFKTIIFKGQRLQLTFKKTGLLNDGTTVKINNSKHDSTNPSYLGSYTKLIRPKNKHGKTQLKSYFVLKLSDKK